MNHPENTEVRQELLEQIVSSVGELPHVTTTIEEQCRMLLRSNLEQIEATAGMLSHPSDQLYERNAIHKLSALPQQATVALQGVAGAYQHLAALDLFSEPELHFFEQFEQVTEAVEQGLVTYGILPFENSSAGTVADITEFISRHDCYINTMIEIKIEHVLAVRPQDSLADIDTVLSHPQALAQCRNTLRAMNLTPKSFANTAMAAEAVSHSESPLGCLCSRQSAALYGLKILAENMQDVAENYTRFVCIAKEALVLPEADTISVVLSFPNKPGALAELLTRFMVLGLDLTRILSLPIAGPGFEVRFHLDFHGNLYDPHVANLLGHMYYQYQDFQFIGNYRYL